MRLWYRTRLLAAVACACCSLSVAQTVVEPVTASVSGGDAHPPAVSSQRSQTREQLRIGPGDLVEVSIYGVGDFKQEGRISDSGEMALPLVGMVSFGGTTV
jgi:polysaccharide export outer membrane protein